MIWGDGTVTGHQPRWLRQWTVKRLEPWTPLLPMLLCAILLAPSVVPAAGPGDAVLSLQKQMESSYAQD